MVNLFWAEAIKLTVQKTAAGRILFIIRREAGNSEPWVKRFTYYKSSKTSSIHCSLLNARAYTHFLEKFSESTTSPHPTILPLYLGCLFPRYGLTILLVLLSQKPSSVSLKAIGHRS